MNERIIVFIAIENKGPHSSAMRPLAGWLTDTADLGVAKAAAAVGGIIPVTIELSLIHIFFARGNPIKGFPLGRRVCPAAGWGAVVRANPSLRPAEGWSSLSPQTTMPVRPDLTIGSLLSTSRML